MSGAILREAILLAAMFAACACQEVPVVRPSPGGIGGGAAGGNALGGEGAGGDGHTAPVGGGGSSASPVYLGVTPNPHAPSQEVLAELQALAAGVRLVVLDVPFEGVDHDGLAERLSGWSSKQLRVVVNVLMVDRKLAHRPGGLEQAAWSDPAMAQALDEVLATIEANAPESVDAVIFGRSVDVYAKTNPEQAEALQALLLHGRDASELPVGIGLSFAGLETPEASLLGMLGEVFAVGYLPGQGDASLSSPLIAKDLDTMANLAGERPIVLQAVGFPSAESLGGSSEVQRQRLANFFAALEPRRSRFPWVVVHQLHDLGEEACATLALDQGEDPTGPWAAYACSTGLRDALDEPKAAWSGFLQATARFAAP